MQNKNFLTKTRWLVTIILLISLSVGQIRGAAASLPFSYDGGNSSNTTGLTCSGLGSDYTNSPKMKLNDKGDYVQVQFSDTPDKLGYKLKVNGSGSGTFKFEVLESSNGSSWSTVKEYTSPSTVTESNLQLSSSSRYVQFKYTTKISGINMGLGAITISKASSKTCVLHDGAGGSTTTNATQGSGTLPNGAAVAGWEFQYWCVSSFADSDHGNPSTTYNSGVTTPSVANLYAVYYNTCTFRYSTSPTAGYHIVNMSPATSGGSGDDYFYTTVGGNNNVYCTIAAGTTVTLNSHIGTNSEFKSWLVTKNGDPDTEVSVANSTATTTTFTMPSYDVDITANFCKDLSTQTLMITDPVAKTWNSTTKKWDITVSWNAVSGATAYKIICGDRTNSSVVLAETNVGNVTSYDIAGLTNNHEHRVKVRAITSCNDTYKDAQLDFTPACTAPVLSATGMIATATSPTTVSVSGGYVTDIPCSISAYGYVYNTTGTPTWSDSKVGTNSSIAVNTPFGAKTIEGLTPGTTYYIRAVVSATGYYAYSDQITVTMPYAITLDKNGGTADGSALVLPNGTTLTDISAPTGQTGYKLEGYYTTSAGGTKIATTAGALQVSVSEGGNTWTNGSSQWKRGAGETFYAIWEGVSYSVRFNRNEGTGGSDMSNQAFTYGTAQNLSACTFTKEGYNFVGWATSAANANANPAVKAYDDEESVNNLSTTDGAVIDLYAIWALKTYTNYRTSCGCPNYSFHSKNSSSVWDTEFCFSQVGTSNLYRTEEIELPTDGVSFKVGYQSEDDVANAKTVEKDWQYMVGGLTTTRPAPTSSYWLIGGHLTSGNTGGAKGYLYVYSNSTEDNKYVGFTPSGYVLRWGKNSTWVSKNFTAKTVDIDETEWNTEVVTLSSSNASDNIYVGLATEDSYVWSNNSEQQRVIFLSPGVWNSAGCKFALWDKTNTTWRGFMQDNDGDGVYEGTVPNTCTEVTFARFDGAKTEPVWDQQYNKSSDQTISTLTDKNMFSVTGWGDGTYCYGDWNTVYAKPGVFRINAGSNLKNWSCKFVPHFVLTYDKNDVGASGTMDPTTVASDAASKNVSVAACGFTAPTGYHFDHWDTAPDGSGTDYAPADTYNLTADVTLYAIWAKNTHTLTWALDGGSISVAGIPTGGTVAYGTSLTAPTVTKTGYTFNAWSPSVPATMPDADATYTATWTPITYSVRFNRNGGTGGSDMSNQNFTYDVAQNLSTCTFTKDGKSFGGWTTNSDGTGDEYANGASVSNLSSTQGAVVDLYAKWVDCTLYTVTLNVNGSAWKTVTQGSCGASIDLSDYADAPACNGGYTLRGWSTTNTATPMFDAPVITTTSTYTPTSDITLYAVYSHTAVIGTRITSTSSISEYENYIVVASGYNKVMCVPTSTTNLAAATDVVKSADGSKCYVTGNGTPLEIMFSDKSTYWMISKYNSSTGNYWYYYSQGSRNALAWYDEDDYEEWWINGDIEKYGDWYDAEDYVASITPSSQWSISIDGSGNATISESTNSRTWKYNSSDVKFGAYTSSNKAISLYQYDEGGVIYTTQPDMTYYTITKGATTNGSISISKGVVCSGSVDVVATADPGYTFSGWSVTSGSGSFGSTSSASTTFTPSANATITATFVAATPHDITWMVNGSAYTTGNPTGSLTAGTSFSTMTLPTAPANNTLSSACSAVADVFVGWSQTDMGFATGQSAPAKYFTDAAGAGTAYGVMGGEDVTFYAVFAQDGSSNYMSRCPNTYTITLDDNGDYGGNGSATATEMSNTLTINTTPTRLGYSVEGYYKEVGTTTKVATYAGALQNGSGSGIADWTNSSSQFIGTSDGTLYTNWNIDTYNITYDNLNGASNSNPATYQVTTATIVLANPGSRTGYTFTGWTYGGNPITQIILGSTGDKTITANWNAEQYTITYKDQGDNAYSGDKTDGRPTGNPATHTYGSATDLVNGTRTGYRFDGWFTAPACTGDPITSIASDAVGPFTLYAKWTAAYTFTFSKNGVVDGTLTLGQVEGGNVIMPNTTVDCGLWTTFEGWVIGDVAETTTEPTTIYKPGDIYVAGSTNQEFKALYSKHEGNTAVYYEKVTSGPKSGTYVIAGDNTNMYIFAGFNADNSSGTYGKKAEDHTFSQSDANIITSRGSGVEVSIIKSTTGKFAIKSGNYCAKPSNPDLNTQETDPASALVWQMDASGNIQEKDATTYFLQINSSNKQFKCYAGTQWAAYLYRKKMAGITSYTTEPGTCVTPTRIDIYYNGNSAYAGDQTISNVPGPHYRTYNPFPNFNSYTIYAGPTDPTGYHFTGWNTAADGSGQAYAPGTTVTTFGPYETITLYAQWERIYTVTLHDQGSVDTRTQSEAGTNVTLPGGTSCGATFTFVGWTDNALNLAADVARPNIVSGAGAWGATELTSDIHLYAVYSRTVETCEDFATGVSGSYYIYYDASNYAVASSTGVQYTIASSGTKQVFYIAYSHYKNAYTIRTAEGYLGWNHDGSDIAKGQSKPYYWTLSGSAGNWKFTCPESGQQLKSSDGSKLKMYAANTSGKFDHFEKASTTHYYSKTNCNSSYSITFHSGGEGSTISGSPNTPGSSSWNSTTHVLSGLADCNKITTFPTATYDGWVFLGWSTEDYSNSGRHPADHLDENGSTDEPYSDILYNTDGKSYIVLGSDVDLYPVFTKFPDNEPFDTENGGDYYIYYLEEGSNDGYGGLVRVYAGEYRDGKRYNRTTSCAAATEFTFTKDGDVWHIWDKTKGQYVAGVSGDDWLVHHADLSGTLDDWTITINSGNQFNAYCQDGGRYLSYSKAANDFMDFSISASPQTYPKVYLGTCEERIFSSEPSPVPTIELTGEPYVTSSAGQQVRATTVFTLSAAHLATVPANKIIVSGTNLKFSTNPAEDASPTTTLSLSLTSGSLSATNIYVYYTPVATEDGLENIIVTAQAYYTTTAKDVQTTGVVHARHLPADFVIAAKWGEKWYALPADGVATTGTYIEVDNVNDPTEATAAPNTAKFGLRKQAERTRKAGHGDYLVFTERLTTATADNQVTLYNGSGTSVSLYSQYTNYFNQENADTRAKHEWIPLTSDFKDYALTSASASRDLSLGNDGVFGALSQDQSYGGKVRLLPATFYEEAPVQIVEWKANSVVVMYTGTETSATTKVGTNSVSSAQTLSTHKLTHGIYELTTSQSLASNAGKMLLLSFGASTKKTFEIPVIITGNSTAYSGHEKQDVVIVNGGKLSAAATKYSYRNIYIYGGGKLKIASGTKLGVNNIILRAGGIATSDIGSSPSATYEYIYPQVELGGELSSTKTNIHYEYITDYYHWYQLCLPFNGTLTSITYPQEYYGNNVKADNKGSWVVKRYAGEIRATGEYDAWKDIETEGATSVTAGHGYLYWGAPKKLTIGGATDRSAWGIQRITMPITASEATSAETANKNISVDSYSEEATSSKPNDQGWNLVGNPYMVNLTDLSSMSIIAGKLVQEKDDKENWTGKWKNDGTNVRYVTVPDNHFDNYEAKTASVAADAGDFMPGRAFFVQIAEGATTLTFAASNRASLMPALFATAKATDIETGIVMSDETKKDEVNFWIKDGKTAEYEYNADYPKTPNATNFNIYGVHNYGDLSWIAISPEIAEGSMAIGYQVPAAGDYMLSLSETYVSDDIEHIFVTDHEASPEVTVDLVERDYIFHVNQAETNNTRFTVSIKLKDEDTGTTTDIDHLKVDSDVPTKFIYQDKMYILYHGIIYDATGKKVREIK